MHIHTNSDESSSLVTCTSCGLRGNIYWQGTNYFEASNKNTGKSLYNFQLTRQV